MRIETWMVVVMVALAAIGAVAVLKAAVRHLRERRAINESMPLLMELTGKSECAVRAELRWMAKQKG